MFPLIISFCVLGGAFLLALFGIVRARIRSLAEKRRFKLLSKTVVHIMSPNGMESARSPLRREESTAAPTMQMIREAQDEAGKMEEGEAGSKEKTPDAKASMKWGASVKSRIFFFKSTASVTREQTQPKVVPLSNLDRTLALLQISGQWTYSRTMDPKTLQKSLGLTLHHYPEIAGRLRKATDGQTRELVCNDAGVPFTVVESTYTLADIHHGTPALKRPNAFEPNPLSDGSFAEVFAINKGAKPVMQVKLTQLAEGGSVLAVTFHHMVVDGFSMFAFMSAWAKETRGMLNITQKGPTRTSRAGERADLNRMATQEPLPSDFVSGAMGVREGKKAIRDWLRKVWLYTVGGISARTFYVTPQELAHMKKEAMEHLAKTRGDGNAFVSTNDVLLAYIWKGMKGLPNFTKGPSSLFQTVNCRARLMTAPSTHAQGGPATGHQRNPSTHNNHHNDFFGNCIVYNGTKLGDVSQMDRGEVAYAIRTSLSKLQKKNICDELAFVNQMDKENKMLQICVAGEPPRDLYITTSAARSCDMNFGKGNACMYDFHIFPLLENLIIIYNGPSYAKGFFFQMHLTRNVMREVLESKIFRVADAKVFDKPLMQDRFKAPSVELAEGTDIAAALYGPPKNTDIVAALYGPTMPVAGAV